MSRPACTSACSVMPANTSIRRRWNGFSSSGMSCHAASEAGRGVSCVFAGIQPSCFCRAKMRVRIASQPSSNLPLYLSAHSLKMWCGPCAAPGAQYMKNGVSGASAWCWRIQVTALSAMSSVKW